MPLRIILTNFLKDISNLFSAYVNVKITFKNTNPKYKGTEEELEIYEEIFSATLIVWIWYFLKKSTSKKECAIHNYTLREILDISGRNNISDILIDDIVNYTFKNGKASIKIKHEPFKKSNEHRTLMLYKFEEGNLEITFDTIGVKTKFPEDKKKSK